MNHERLLLDFLMTILQLYLRIKHKAKYGEGLKTLTPKQMLERLPIAIAQIKAGNTSGNIPNEITQIIYFLCRANEITKKVYNSIMNPINLLSRMDTIFMDS